MIARILEWTCEFVSTPLFLTPLSLVAQICASILGREGWSPVLTVIAICLTIQSMLASCKVGISMIWGHLADLFGPAEERTVSFLCLPLSPAWLSIRVSQTLRQRPLRTTCTRESKEGERIHLGHTTASSYSYTGKVSLSRYALEENYPKCH